MFEYSVCTIVDDPLHAPDGQIEFFSQALISDTIKEPSGKDKPVALCIRSDHPFMHKQLDIASAQIRDLHQAFTRPDPLHVPQVL